MNRAILHVDLNNFFASVEEKYNPRLKNFPMAVSGNPDDRQGIILAKNIKAKILGVKTAETIYQARKKAPNLLLVPPRHDLYSKYSILARKIYYKFTDKVEFFGIDEAWLDVTKSLNIFGDVVNIANMIKNKISKDLGLTVSIGISFNKTFSKLASDTCPPNSVNEINFNNYRSKIFKMQVSKLLYIGEKTTKTLNDLGIFTIYDLAEADTDLLSKKLGRHGLGLQKKALGNCESEVIHIDDNFKNIKSIGKGETFSMDIYKLIEIKRKISKLSDNIGTELRKKMFRAGTLKVELKYSDFVVRSKQKSLEYSTNSSKIISDNAEKILLSIWNGRNKIRAITVTAIKLTKSKDYYQQSFFLDNSKFAKLENLEKSIDKIRDKYGKEAIKNLPHKLKDNADK